MAQVINTNVMSLNAQRSLSVSQKSLSVSLERLSSGLRINRAADDAAGMAVSETMTLQIRGNSQAIRNTNDGISMMNTAEGASQEISNILQRMNELAVQAANGTYGTDDTAQLDLEFKELQTEITSIANDTKFNGVALLNSAGSVSIQVGDESGDTLAISTKDLTAATLGVDSGAVASVTNSAAIGAITAAIKTVNTARSTFGASTNRMESKIRNLENTVENISAARSRIQDADFAAETANLTRAQILQQAGVAMLAQANAMPQNALSLLR